MWNYQFDYDADEEPTPYLLKFIGFTQNWETGVYLSGSWTHVCGTYDGSTVEMFVDGSSIGSQSLTLNTGTARDFGIGCRMVSATSGPDRFFHGYIKDVRWLLFFRKNCYALIKFRSELFHADPL